MTLLLSLNLKNHKQDTARFATSLLFLIDQLLSAFTRVNVCEKERDGEDVKIFTHKNNWENLKTFFFWKFLEEKRRFPFIKITVLDIEYLITESMLWESVRVPLLSR